MSSTDFNDPMGQAILDFASTKENQDIVVVSEICDDDVIPAAYLFRSFEEMPKIEQMALEKCEGRILDVGAGAGIHAQFLQNKGKDVSCIDISPGIIQHLQNIDIPAKQINFFDLEHEKFDTLLFLMNGLGIAGKLSNLEFTLIKAKSLLSENGKILCDSSDIKYLYEDEEGGYWIDLNAGYYGDFKFQMIYKNHTSEWFDWLYVDFQTLKSTAEKVGFKIELIHEEDQQYLAELTVK